MTATAMRASQLAQYNADAILSAPPARLLTMLYDRLLLDLARAQFAQETENWQVASQNLLHAQAIVTELASTLKTDAWDGAADLLGIYNYAAGHDRGEHPPRRGPHRGMHRAAGTAPPGLA